MSKEIQITSRHQLSKLLRARLKPFLPKNTSQLFCASGLLDQFAESISDKDAKTNLHDHSDVVGAATIPIEPGSPDAVLVRLIASLFCDILDGEYRWQKVADEMCDFVFGFRDALELRSIRGRNYLCSSKRLETEHDIRIRIKVPKDKPFEPDPDDDDDTDFWGQPLPSSESSAEISTGR